MTLQYVITGGQLKIDKLAFAKEILSPDSPMKRLLNTIELENSKQPKITKLENLVIINYNDAADVLLDEGFFDMFKKLKNKYRGKLKGKIVIRITALTSYHVVLDLNSDDEKIIYE